MNEEIDLILSRYFSGEATEIELQKLDEWLSGSEENENYFFRMTSVYRMMKPDTAGKTPDTEKALGNFIAYMNRQEEKSVKKRTISRNLIFGAAAAVLLILIGIFTFYFSGRPDTTIQLAAETHEKEFILFDLVEVNLEAGSKMMYKSKIKNEVELSGKATFAIRETSEKGLIVYAGETRIQDIGTIFTVSAFPHGAHVSVEVEEGEVLFYTDQQQGIRIKAGERGIYNPVSKKFTHYEKKDAQPVSPVNSHPEPIAPELLSETEIPEEKTIVIQQPSQEAESNQEDIVFDSVPLDEVINTLISRYGVKIIIGDPSLKEMLIRVSFAPHESVENILNIIAETLSLKITVTNDAYYISK